MKNRNSIIILLAILVTVVYACKKKDSTTTTTPTPTKTQKDYLMDGKWQITAIKVGSILGNQDLCDTMPACRKDNLASFLSSGKVLSDEGPTKCSSSAPQTDSSGSWSLTSDFKELTVNASWVLSGHNTFQVLELTTSSMKITQSFDTTINMPPFPAYTTTIKDTVIAKKVN
jgi:hypothetical protein